MEPRNDMLPDVSQTDQEIKEEPKQEVVKEIPVKEDAKTEVKEEVKETPKGYVPYDALHAERSKRKELELQLEELKASKASQTQDDEYISDEGRLLGSKISALEKRIKDYEKKETERTVLLKYPQINDKLDEFQEFVEAPENTGIDLERVAKLFVVEKGLNEEAPKRKGLEKATSGGKQPQSSGISADDLKRMRENEPRKYIKMLREGRINPDDIK